MSKIAFVFIVLLSHFGHSQSINFGDSTTLFVGEGTNFFFGGSTTLGGSLDNEGTLDSYDSINLGSNTSIGNITFSGVEDQAIFGTTLMVIDFVVDKDDTLFLNTNEIEVTGELRANNGIIKTQKEDDILVSGSSQTNGAGYVQGKLFGKSKGGPVTFPMGVNGAPNYVTISNLPDQTVVSVECKLPNSSTLIRDQDIIGISDDVEWIISSEDSVEIQLTIDYSGIDWTSLVGDTTINSDLYSPAIVLFSKDDSLYHALNGTIIDVDRGFLPPTEESITINESFWIGSSGRKLALAFIPLIKEPENFIPTAFSPGATIEDNKVFRAFYSGAIVTEISIAVYDSFNKLIFSANDGGDNLDLSQYTWDGTLKSGLEAPEGVYYYKIRIVSEAEVINKTGAVLLVK
ncbi:C-terminal domain of CHU protein family protein [Ekhidna lutea]|uniref:C-terminal domain of CHU protein family protein n=1 Tax=Ekhidna lutea TaxID=447679 RepID=A0A239L4U7_EKHLU|nr:gliding motility-associated C-terminal domain-containing protein [Ekhidna lutea]SNT24938.1 C-terminal domain of CHU protein family protein [Ekhidna lutea]